CVNQLPYVFNGKSYNGGGTYTDTLHSTTTCDTIYTITLTVSPLLTKTISPKLCANHLPYVCTGKSYNSGGTYTDTLHSTTTCDTIYTMTLTVSPLPLHDALPILCANQLPYVFNGKSYNSGGTYTDTLHSTTTCDTIYTITLTVSPLLTKTISPSVCANQLHNVCNHNSTKVTCRYRDTPHSTPTRPTIYTIPLPVRPLLPLFLYTTLFRSQLPYVFNGKSYNSGGTYTDTLHSTTTCDTIYTITLTVSPLLTKTISPSVCANQLPYVFNGKSYNSGSTYTDSLHSTTTCDTIYTITLTVSPLLTKTISPSVCANQLPYVFNGKSYNSGGTYTDTLHSTTTCDTIYTITLTVSPLLTKTISPSVCANQLPYVFNGKSYNSGSTYTDSLHSTTTCDTIYTITLTVSPLLTKTISPSVCANQLPYVFNGKSYNSGGTYTDTLHSTTTCDTIYTITLTVSPLLTKTISPSVCANQLPYVFNGKSYNSGGTYTDTLHSTTTCDTIYTINLTVSPLLTKTISPSVCANQLPYVFNGNSYNSGGTYTDTLHSTTTCHTIYTIPYTMFFLSTKTISPSVCANQLPYVFNGKSYNSGGTYTDTLHSTTTCDTIYTINLTVSPLLTKT